LVCCGALLALAAPALARGHLDRSFGDNGVVDLSSGPGGDSWSGTGVLRVGPRGDLFLTEEAVLCSRGGCPSRVYLRRYLSNGKRAAGFGDSGLVTVGVTDGYALLAVDSGRPLVALDDGDGVTVHRFRATGSPDRSFGRAGSVTVACDCYPGTLEVGAGREPWLMGYSEFKKERPFRGSTWVFARLRADGSHDRGFGGDGIVRRPMPGFYAPDGMEIEPDRGALLYGSVCCRFPSKPFVQRLSPRGQLRPRYAAATRRALHGLPGTRQGEGSWEETAVVRRPDGRVEVFGSDYHRTVAVRLLRNGRRDPSFGRGGVRTFRPMISDAVADGRGGTLAVAYVRGRGYEAMRLRPDGSFDRRFGWVDLPGAFNEGGMDIFSQGRGRAIVFSRGVGFCRQGCPAEPKLFRVVDGSRR
jgi:hypothetical protein